MRFLFEGIIELLAFMAGVIWLVGGAILHPVIELKPIGKIELASLDLWMMLLCLLVLLYRKFYPQHPLRLIRLSERAMGRLLEPLWSRRSFYLLIIWIFGGLFLAHTLRHWNFKTHYWDHVVFNQALFWPWGTPVFKCDLCINGTLWAEHISLSLALLAPITTFFKSNELIFAIQALCVGIPLVLAITRGPTQRRPELWFCLGFVFVCHRALRNGLIWDFGQDDIAFAALLISGLCLYWGQGIFYFLFLILSLISKENVPLVTLFLVFPILFEPSLPFPSKQRKVIAGVTVLFSLAWLWIAFHDLIPYFSRGNESSPAIVGRFPPGYGSTPSEILWHILTSPSALALLIKDNLPSFQAFKYLVLLLGPFVYFIRKGSWWLLPALPGIAMNLLPISWTQKSLLFHYDFIILPFLILATLSIAGVDRPRQLGSPRFWLIAMSIALCFSGRWPVWHMRDHFPTSKQIHLRHFLNSLPNEGVLGATEFILPQVLQVKNLRLLLIPKASVPSDPEQARELFWKLNSLSPRGGGILQLTPREANRMVLDLSESWQAWLYRDLSTGQNPQWQVERSDFDSGFVLIKRKNSV